MRLRVKVRVRVSTGCGAARAPEAAPEAMRASSSACHPSLRTSAVMPASQSPRNSASRYLVRVRARVRVRVRVRVRARVRVN